MSRGTLWGPTLSLVLLWAGLAVPLLDRDCPGDAAQAIHDADGPSRTFSHDHRLCLLLQASPGWILQAPPSSPNPTPVRSLPALPDCPGIAAEATSFHSARAPPSFV